MSEGGGGFNHNLWAQQNLSGSGGSGGGSGQQEFKPNDQESPELAVSAAPTAIHTGVAKLGGSLPGPIGWFLRLFPSKLGEVNALAGFESEGYISKPMNVKGGSMFDTTGGPVYQIAAALIKNGSIPGGNPYGEGGGDNGGGGGSGSSGDSGFAMNDHGGHSGPGGLDSGPIIEAGGGHQFVYASVSERELGFLHPSETPSTGGRGMGTGMDMMA